MADTLLLRKGSLANLASLEKIAGAISITTDIPGIYLDTSANERIRIGDFIPVATLSVLNTLATNGRLSKYALYYVEDQNLLIRYSETAVANDDGTFSPGLVWINNHTSLEESIETASTTANSALTTANNNTTAITNLQQAIGGSYNSSDTVYKDINAVKTSIGSSDDATTANTVYGTINKEVAALSDRIDAITGDETGSLAELQDQIDDLVTEDTSINNLIKKIYGNNNTIPENNNKTIHQNAVDIGNLQQADNAINSLIKKIYGNNNTIPENNNKTIHQNATDIVAIKGEGWTDETIKGNATDISNINTRIDNLVKIDNDNSYSSILEAVTEAKDYANTTINNTIAAANAMTFKGTIANKTSAWWTGKVNAGDTYVVSTEFTYSGSGNTAQKCHIGDLIVASHDQGDATTYSTTIVLAGTSVTNGWYLIKTGYDTALEPSLTVTNNSNTINLLSHTSTNLGSVSFGTNAVSNVNVSSTGTAININLQWVEF